MSWLDEYLKRLFLLLGVVAVVSIVAIMLLRPATWGEFGEYRGAALHEEANKSIYYGTNESCISCHEDEYDMHSASVHKTVSCEICHSAYNDHIKDNKKYAKSPFKIGDAQIEQCLMCHQKVVGRDQSFPMVNKEDHLDKLGVKQTNKCNQCHTVHAPLENIKRVKALRLSKEKSLDE